MSLFRNSNVAVACLIATVSLSMSRAKAVDIVDDSVQIDDRIAQVIQTANSLCWEMHRYHQQQPDFADAYRTAKQLWTQAGQIRDELRTGPLETDTLLQQTAEMNQAFAQIEKALSKWGPGDRSVAPSTTGSTPREIVTEGVGVDLPLLGIHVGGRPQVVVTDDPTPVLQRRRLHKNSHGSKRNLERELAAVKLALNYLAEDEKAGSDPLPAAQATNAQPTPVGQPTLIDQPTPAPPEPDSTLVESRKVNGDSKPPAATTPKKP